jgi:UDP-N-acetylglucosamine acyltransferase
VADGVIISNAALLAGHVKIESHVIISGAALLHHFVTIGKYAFVAGGAAVNVDVPPFMMVVGQRQKVQTINAVGLRRRGFSKESIDALREAHRIVWRQGLPRPESIARLEAEFAGIAEVRDLVASLKASLGGKNGRALESLRRDVP